jgi:Outer membrane protein beta-barrel domain
LKQLPLFLLFFILLAFDCQSQERWGQLYVSGGMGGMNYSGDLQEKAITAGQMRLGGTVGVTYQARPHLAGNFSFTLGSIGATDAKNGPRWVYRNLSFKTVIFEASVTAEYDFINIDQPDDQSFADMNPKRVTPYIFAGLGLFHFNPYTYDLSGKKVYLQPLGTEGQVTGYALWQASFPIGVGVRYALSNTVMLSGEFNFRKTLTDYLDDVSHHQYADTTELLATHGQEAASLSYRADEIANTPYKFYGYRGNPDKKDVYYSFMIKFSYQLFAHRPRFYYGY